MDLTPYLETLQGSNLDEVLLSVAVSGKVALAMKGRFFLRCLCESFRETELIGCAVTDEASCLNYLSQEPYELLICTDFLESGSGFDLARKAKALQPQLKVVMLALGDAIPVEHAEASWLEAVVAEADFIEDQKPLEAAVLAVMGHHAYRSPSLRSGQLPYLLASGLTDREIAEQLVVSEETARTYTKRLLKTLEVNNRVQAVLKGMRCGMVKI
jgi:DNA-binding NarL/FixJ family response regulator